MSGRAQVRLDEDVVEALDRSRDDRSLAQHANAVLRQGLGLTSSEETKPEPGPSTVRAPSGSITPRRGSNAGWQGRR